MHRGSRVSICLKNYSREKWNEALASKDWSTIHKQNGELQEIVDELIEQINKALDEVMPIKSFTVKSFFNTHLGYPLNFIFAFHGHIMGAYLCLAEVKWVKTRVPGVKPLLGVKGWVP